MEKSIENIWKTGFEADKTFELPVIKDLYTKKSNLIIDKIKSVSKWDNLSLLPIAVVLFGIFAFMGKLFLGAYLAALILSLFFLNKKMLRKLEIFDPNSNTYLYLKTYYSQLKQLQKFNTNLLAIGLPIVIIPAYWMFFSNTPLLTSFMDFNIALQFIIVAIIAVVLGGLGVFSYKLSTRLVYGKLITRIEEIINDMEELSKI